MHIRCPHCHNALKVVEEWSSRDIECTSCGSVFTLADDDATRVEYRAGSKIAHFRLVDFIGSGAFGSVWKARDSRLERFVAIKTPRFAEVGSEETATFLREAKSAGQLSHPHVVTVYEVGKHDGRLYIVSELIDGVTLKQWTRRQPIPATEAATLCSKLASALHHAHERGIIHRDVKPSNIMLNEEGEPLLTDFGLASRVGGELTVTVTGAVLGTLQYMSPEQAAGQSRDADARSDVYSLGVVLYELLCGAVPFSGEKQMLIHQIRREEPASPRKLNSSIPKDLETICLKCLQKKPEHRFQTAEELEAELQRFLSGEPILSRPISKPTRVARWAKRNPYPAAFVGSLGCLLLTLAIGGPWIAIQQAALAQSNASLLEEQNQRTREGLLSQVRLVDSIGYEAFGLTLDSFRAESQLAIPLLQDRLAEESDLFARVRLATALLQIGEFQTEYFDELIDSIPGASAEWSREIIDGLLAAEDTEYVLRRLREGGAAAENDQVRTRYASTLLHLGEAAEFEAALSYEDPTLRRELIHGLTAWSGDASRLTETVERILSSSGRSGFCLAIGQIDPAEIPEPTMQGISHLVKQWYSTTGDAPTRSGSDWLLRTWGIDLPSEEVDSALASADADAAQDRSWFRTSNGLTMLRVSAGTVTLGENSLQPTSRIRVQEAEVKSAFWMADSEVTRSMFEEFLADDSVPAEQKPGLDELDVEMSPFPNCPVHSIRVKDAAQFCNWLSQREGKSPCYERLEGDLDPSADLGVPGIAKVPRWKWNQDANGYRLPTFTEWELATRAGTRSAFFFGDATRVDRLPLYGCFAGNSRVDGVMRSAPVRTKMPNDFGFFDLVGNVREICWDLPTKKAAFEYERPVRGGAFDMGASQCCSGIYLTFFSSEKLKNIGFRIACSIVD